MVRVVVVGLGLLVADVAHAHLGRPRTPVQWDEHACMTVVDRGVDPVLALRYTIPREDLPTPGELADSRRHQFLALCRGHAAQRTLPGWLTKGDVDAAVAAGLVDAKMLGADDVFASSAAWHDCLFRITADAERRPITFAAAAEPVLWDTSHLPAGPYVVQGYTWDPGYNFWWVRSGVVHVVDDPDPNANRPAAGVANGAGECEDGVLAGDALPIRGCVRAMAGSTIVGEWAPAYADTLVWTAFTPELPVAGEAFALPLTPQAGDVGVHEVRAVVRDPLGRSFAAYMDRAVVVFADEPSHPPSDCGLAATTGADSEGPEATTSGDVQPEGEASSTSADATAGLAVDDGCGCTQTGSGAALAWPGVLALRRRSRR